MDMSYISGCCPIGSAAWSTVLTQRGNDMRGDTGKGGSYRHILKLMFTASAFAVIDQSDRGDPAPCFTSPSFHPYGPCLLLHSSGCYRRACGTGRLPCGKLPVSTVSLGCSHSPGWDGFCSTLVRRQLTKRNKGDVVQEGMGTSPRAPASCSPVLSLSRAALPSALTENPSQLSPGSPKSTEVCEDPGRAQCQDREPKCSCATLTSFPSPKKNWVVWGCERPHVAGSQQRQA